ncbi:MAG: hypothetical protein SFU20_04125 [Chitinophagaceae bacterium]|nr:hypothetical protein [Chitinophagaceae bacterium]
MANENLIDNMTTLLSCLKKAKEKGFTRDFTITEHGLSWLGGNQFYRPEEISIVDFFRYEGKSDPDENAILYLMETKDGNKGTFTTTFGIYAEPMTTEFVIQIEEIMKQKSGDKTK